MKNWKTTLCGILAALPYILKIFGIECPADVSNILTGSGLSGIGLFSKDHNVTGGTKQQ